MHSILIKFSVSTFTLLLLSVVTGFGAQSATPAARTPAHLGLFRLNDETKPDKPAPLAATKFAVDELSPAAAAGAAKSRKNDLDVLILDAGKEWSRPLRGSNKDVTFVSFQLLASQTTILEIAGARLGLTAGPIPGSLQLMFDDSAAGALQWRSLNLHLSTATYGGKNLASLPILTLRLDPAADTWDLYSSGRLLAHHLPLIGAKKDQRQFVLKAGVDGAWLSGLVMTDENPLYEDDNANGIDDAFEKQQRGAVLSATASLPERKLLAQEWRDAQRTQPPPALLVKRPRPDGTSAITVPQPKS